MSVATNKIANTQTVFDANSPIVVNSNITYSVSSVGSPGATKTVDMLGEVFQRIALTGNITINTTNRAAGRSVSLIIVGDGSNRNLTFPAWVFLGTIPAQLAANKTAVLSITCVDGVENNIIAAYGVQQ